MDATPGEMPTPVPRDLTKISPFVLGPITIEPAARRISAGERHVMLEPQVMRVLLALAGNTGQVLSRDDLVVMCWDGRVVGDKAINRAIGLLRQALSDLIGGSVQLETIIKVGFRLVVCEAAAPVAPADQVRSDSDATNDALLPRAGAGRSGMQAGLQRRAILASLAGAGAVAGLGYWALGRSQRTAVDPRAVDLFRSGQQLARAGEPNTMRRAIENYKQALAIDPQFAEAWAALALSYRSIAANFPTPPSMADGALVRSAAQRALDLDPDNLDGKLALISVEPNFRHWGVRERRLQAFVEAHPEHWHASAQLGTLLADLGRFKEALVRARRTVGIDPGLITGWVNHLWGAAYAGEHQEADIVFEQAASRWPAHLQLWSSRVNTLLFARRYAEAAAFARERRNRPDAMPPNVAEIFAGFAESIMTGRGMDQAVARIRQNLSVVTDTASAQAPLLMDLGAQSDAFDALEAYYFGGNLWGQQVSPPRSTDWRWTTILSTSQLSSQGDHPRYRNILERSGLEAYWASSEHQPDHRKA